MKLAPQRVAAFLRDPGSCRVVLLYGDDAGLIRDRAATLVRGAAGSLDDPFRVAELNRDGLARLADEAHVLFGSWAFDHYDYLINISGKLREHPSIGGQEHGDSSDDTGGPGVFTTSAGKESVGDTLSHEYSHSWNGKYRRPAGEKVRDYQQPYDDSLNWVYEGLTTYLGHVLAARAGFWSLEEFYDEWANEAAAMNYRPGRLWRNDGTMKSKTGLIFIFRARYGG